MTDCPVAQKDSESYEKKPCGKYRKHSGFTPQGSRVDLREECAGSSFEDSGDSESDSDSVD